MELKNKNSGNNIYIKLKKLFCEFLGTFILTYIGSWAIIFGDTDDLGSESVGFAHGITLIIFTWLCYPTSGAHFNPAITLGMIVIRKIEWSTGMFYIIIQFLGAICGAMFIHAQLTIEISEAISEKSVLGIPRPDSQHYDVSGLWTELVGTFFLMYAYSAFVVDSNKQRPMEVFPVVIGFTYFICYVTVGDISGGGFNPARALGPAIIIGKIGNTQFMQFFGPLCGAVISAIIYKLIFVDEDDEDEDDEQYTDEIKEYAVPVKNQNHMMELQ
jgi:MIP family channel proteins